MTVDATSSGLGGFVRVGSAATLPAGFEQVTWYGNGPVETFSDRKTGARQGIWETTVSEFFFPYEKVDESVITDVVWMKVENEELDNALVVVGRDFMETNAMHFTSADLDAADHPYKLTPRAETIISVNFGTCGTGGATCGPGTLTQYRLPSSRVYNWNFTLVPVDADADAAEVYEAVKGYHNVESYVIDDIDDKSANDLDTVLPPTAGYVAGETDETRAMKGWFTVNDPERILTDAMSDGNAFTVSARVYVPAEVLSTNTGSWDGNDKHNMIASLGDTAFGLRITTGSNGSTAVQTFVGDGGSWYQIDSPRLGTEFTNQWHDIAVTNEGSTLILYVDGAAVASRDDAGKVYNDGVAFGVGWDPTKSLRTSELTLESIAVFSEALTAEELAASHTAADENVLLWMDFEKAAAHEHSFGQWVVTKEATCTETGVETRTCACGETETREVAALGHIEMTVPAVEPTCTEDGLTEGKKCAVCGEILVAQEVIPATGHAWKGTGCENCDATRENPFVDVPEDSFYIDPVLWAVEKGITTGATATTFNPNGQCQRAQVVTFLWRAAGSPEPTGKDNPFQDVKETDFYYKAVLWAVEKGITNGLTADTFGPCALCNRAQVVTFLYRAMGEPEVTATEHPFTDVAEDQFYFKAMLWAVGNGITNGLTTTTFGPTAICNRAQVVTFLYRTLA